MEGRVLQVNVSPGGVPKHPVDRAWVREQGLDGDAHEHRYVHGGPHRAVSLLGIEAIERVQADGHPIEPGSVGENLTTTGIELSGLPIGTRLTIGNGAGPVLELSAAAGPCDVIKGSFRDGKSGRISILTHPSDSRMYARVVVEGEVCTGDPITVSPPADESAATVFHLLELSMTSIASRGSRCGRPRRGPATTSGSSTTATCRPPPRRTSPEPSSTGRSACGSSRSRPTRC
jgi:MOSC domain-containing protein YiiM